IFLLISGNDVEQLITINQFTLVIHEHYAVTIAIKGNTYIGTQLDHFFLKSFRLGRATTAIYISAIGLNKQRGNMCPQFGEYIGSNVVGGTIGTIQNDMHSFEVKSPRHSALTKFNIAARCIRNT